MNVEALLLLLASLVGGCSSSSTSSSSSSSSGGSDAPACKDVCAHAIQLCPEQRGKESLCEQNCNTFTPATRSCASKATTCDAVDVCAKNNGSSSGGTLLTEGAKCSCADSTASLCQSTDGPCEAALTCLTGTCVDKSKTCTADANCAAGYTCTELIAGTGGSSLGTYCVKQ